MAGHGVAKPVPPLFDPLGGARSLLRREQGNLAHLHEVDADRIIDVVAASIQFGVQHVHVLAIVRAVERLVVDRFFLIEVQELIFNLGQIVAAFLGRCFSGGPFGRWLLRVGADFPFTGLLLTRAKVESSYAWDVWGQG